MKYFVLYLRLGEMEWQVYEDYSTHLFAEQGESKCQAEHPHAWVLIAVQMS